MNKPILMILLSTAWGLYAMTGQANARILTEEITVEAPLEAVWHAWTTVEGVKTFFARDANIELHTDGNYEIFFFPNNPPGQRGAEGTRVLAVEPRNRLAFTWDAPPKWPHIRGQRTMVVVTFHAADDRHTQVVLTQMGWGAGNDWDQVFEYFTGAWHVVLARLDYRFRNGPIDWDNISPDLLYRG